MSRLAGLLVLAALILGLLVLPWLVPLVMRQTNSNNTEAGSQSAARKFHRISKCAQWEPASADQMLQNLVAVNRTGMVAWNSWTAAENAATVCLLDTKNLKNNAQDFRIQIHSGTKLVRMALDDTGTLLAALTSDGRVTYWDVRNRGAHQEPVPLHDSEFAVNILFDDRSKLWIVTARGGVYAHDFDAQRLQHITQMLDSKTLGTKIESFHAVTVVSDPAAQKIHVFQNYDLTQTLADGVDFALDPACQALCVLAPDQVSVRVWAKHLTSSFEASASSSSASAGSGPLTLDKDETLCGMVANLGLATSVGRVYPVFQGRISATPIYVEDFPPSSPWKTTYLGHEKTLLVVDRNSSNFGAIEVFCVQ